MLTSGIVFAVVAIALYVLLGSTGQSPRVGLDNCYRLHRASLRRRATTLESLLCRPFPLFPARRRAQRCAHQISRGSTGCDAINQPQISPLIPASKSDGIVPSDAEAMTNPDIQRHRAISRVLKPSTNLTCAPGGRSRPWQPRIGTTLKIGWIAQVQRLRRVYHQRRD